MRSDYEAELAAAVTRFLADIERLAQHHRDLLVSTIAPSLAVTAAPSPGRRASTVRTQPTRAAAATDTSSPRPTKASAAKVTPAKASPAKLTPAKASPAKLTPAKACSAEVTPAKACSAEVAATKASTAKATASEAARPRRRTAPTTPTSATPEVPTPVKLSSEPTTQSTVTSEAPPPTSTLQVGEAPAIAAAPVTPTPVLDERAATTPKVPDPNQCRGVVLWYSIEKGYGFLRGDDGIDAFVHASALDGFGALAEGQPVTYTAKWTRKGLQAVSVERPSPSARGSR